MSSGGAAGPPVRPSRAERTDAATRRRRIEAIVAVCLVVVGLVFAAVQLRAKLAGAPSSPSPTPTAPGAPSTLLAVSVTGSPNALLGVVGTGGGRPSAGVVLPGGMTVIVPGQGDALTQQVQALPASSMRVAVSNAAGVWAAHYAVMTLDTFSATIDRAGGISVDLPDIFIAEGQASGPGPTHLSGAQVQTLLRQRSDDAAARWAATLQGFLAVPPPVQPGDLADTDDAAVVIAQLSAAAGAQIQVAPTEDVGGSATIAAQPAMDQLIGGLFGTPTPVRALVQNGNGEPGIGETVATDIIPAGFRVVLSQNATTFNHPTTQIVAIGADHQADAQRARQALGVGTVAVTQVPSGLADVTILVGRDFRG
ncbi:MAG TPA: LytR C-terminal domain-containing protein [Actinomycetota bacterium]|nr:LytR C-terminal domain-containing protein [Actinomycetota bacterium]